jgi:hypothetical protein
MTALARMLMLDATLVKHVKHSSYIAIRDIRMKQITHGADEYGSRFPPVKWFIETILVKCWAKGLDPVITVPTSQPLSHAPGIAMIAARVHPTTSGHRIPGLIRPFNLRRAHLTPPTCYNDSYGEPV